MRALAALLVVACGGAPPAPPRASSRDATMFRFDLLEPPDYAMPARSEACWRAIDAVGERVGRVLVLPPEEVSARLAPCPRADVAAVEALFAKREDRLVGGLNVIEDVKRLMSLFQDCTDCGRDEVVACELHQQPELLARWEWHHVADDESSSWLDAERCCAALVPRLTAAMVLEHARKWVAAGKAERVADCLERCTLAPATRAELERLRR